MYAMHIQNDVIGLENYISKQMTDFIAWPSIPSIPQSHVYCNESVEPLGASTHQTNGKAQYIAFWS